MIAPFLLLLCLGQNNPDYPPPGSPLDANRLDDLVAPIALYPDPLLSQLLVASTYPLEIVAALRWLDRNSNLPGPVLAESAMQQNWDPSIQALVVFPDLLRRLNQDITWTTNLGNAFLTQQGDVMDAVQRMRARASEAGRLDSNTHQIVNNTTDNGQTYIQIEPADPYMMYLPEYDPLSIWGPPLYYPYARWRYPRYNTGIYFGFGLGISMGTYFGGGWGGWGGWGWNPGWGGRSIIINNNFLLRHNFNQFRGGGLHPGNSWAHDPIHRQGVPYPSPALRNFPRPNLRPPVSAPAGGDRMGNRRIAPAIQAPNHGAFGGIREGGAARGQSDRGYSSLGPGRSGGNAPQARGHQGNHK